MLLIGVHISSYSMAFSSLKNVPVTNCSVLILPRLFSFIEVHLSSPTFIAKRIIIAIIMIALVTHFLAITVNVAANNSCQDK